MSEENELKLSFSTGTRNLNTHYLPSIRQHRADAMDIRSRNERALIKLSFALAWLGCQNMAGIGMTANYLSPSRNSKPLGSAFMCLQLQFPFRQNYPPSVARDEGEGMATVGVAVATDAVDPD